MDIGGGFLAARDFNFATTGGARSDENGVPAFGEERLEAVDAFAAAKFDAHIEDVATFLVGDRLGQAKPRNLRADHAAGFGVLVEHDAMIAKWREIAGHRERGGPATAERDALAASLRH